MCLALAPSLFVILLAGASGESKRDTGKLRDEARSNQGLFLVPLNGGRWHIIPQLAVYTTYIPPFRGTRNNH